MDDIFKHDVSNLSDDEKKFFYEIIKEENAKIYWSWYVNHLNFPEQVVNKVISERIFTSPPNEEYSNELGTELIKKMEEHDIQIQHLLTQLIPKSLADTIDLISIFTINEHGYKLTVSTMGKNSERNLLLETIKTGLIESIRKAYEDLNCVICFLNIRNCLVFPCKHLAMCSNCYKTIKNASNVGIDNNVRSPTCPICRGHIQEARTVENNSDNFLSKFRCIDCDNILQEYYYPCHHLGRCENCLEISGNQCHISECKEKNVEKMERFFFG